MEKSEELRFYHIGRIIKIINSKSGKNFDHKNKAAIEMWDNNIITCEIGNASVKEDDFVVVRFNGIIQSASNNIFMNPSQVTDVVSKEAGETIWRSYKNFYEKAKPAHPLTG
jgi:hypothetical protein